jgi:glycosyltransferase involved in cell wall biosynthesis
MRVSLLTPLDIKYSVSATEKLIYEYASYLKNSDVDVELLVPTKVFDNHNKLRKDYKDIELQYSIINKKSINFIFFKNYYYSMFYYFNLPTNRIVFLPYSPYYYITNILTKPTTTKYIIGAWNMHLYAGEHSQNHRVLSNLLDGVIRTLFKLRGTAFLDTLYFLVENSQQKYYIIKNLHIRAQKIFYIPLFIDTNEFSVTKNNSKKLRVLHIGGIEKNAMLMAKIIHNAIEKNIMEDFEFWFIGKSMPDELITLSKSYKNIKNYGMVTDKTKRILLSKADVLAVTSVEGFGLKILEAFASGLEVICLDNPACTDISATGLKIHTIDRNMPENYLIILKKLFYKKQNRAFSLKTRMAKRKLLKKNFDKAVVTPKFFEMLTKINST